MANGNWGCFGWVLPVLLQLLPLQRPIALHDAAEIVVQKTETTKRPNDAVKSIIPSCDNVAVGCDHVISIDIPQMQFSTGALPIGTNMLIFKQVRLRIKSVDGRGVRLQMRVL